MEACLAFRMDVIETLINNGADVNKQDKNGCTALMRASYSGYMDLCKDLIRHGADKNIVDKDGNKAADYVRQQEFSDLKEYLK